MCDLFMETRRQKVYTEIYKLNPVFLCVLKIIKKLSTITKRSWKLKGYLRYKTITSQNVSSEAQIKNFFIS